MATARLRRLRAASAERKVAGMRYAMAAAVLALVPASASGQTLRDEINRANEIAERNAFYERMQRDEAMQIERERLRLEKQRIEIAAEQAKPAAPVPVFVAPPPPPRDWIEAGVTESDGKAIQVDRLNLIVLGKSRFSYVRFSDGTPGGMPVLVDCGSRSIAFASSKARRVRKHSIDWVVLETVCAFQQNAYASKE